MSTISSTSSLKASCPCCHYIAIKERNIYEICPVCYWEDEGEKWDLELDIESGANHGLTLREGRKNFAEFGASDKKWIGKVVSKENRTKFQFKLQENTL
ncbi:MAG: hypothetical protein JXR11_06895 [Balneola sp.]